MQAREEEEREDGAKERERHIGLRIPDIALRCKELIRAAPAEQRDGPFDQLVKGAEGKADGDGEDIAPDGRRHEMAADDHLARDNRRHEALRQMAEPVVIIALKTEPRLDIIKERHFGVSVMPADHQDNAMDQDKGVKKRG